MIQPRGRRLLCRAIETEETMPGGKIILTKDRIAMETKSQAEVVAAGPGEYDPELEEYVRTDPRLKPGTWILHAEFTRVPVDDEFFLLHERDVVAILGEA